MEKIRQAKRAIPEGGAPLKIEEIKLPDAGAISRILETECRNMEPNGDSCNVSIHVGNRIRNLVFKYGPKREILVGANLPNSDGFVPWSEVQKDLTYFYEKLVEAPAQ